MLIIGCCLFFNNESSFFICIERTIILTLRTNRSEVMNESLYYMTDKLLKVGEEISIMIIMDLSTLEFALKLYGITNS